MKVYTIHSLLQGWNKISNKLVTKLLHGLFYILKWPLNVTFVSIPEPVVFSGNSLVLYWEVSGCYKIMINEAVCLPGTTTKIYLDSSLITRPLQLQFYGCKEVVQKRVIVNLVALNLEKALALQTTPGSFNVAFTHIPIKRFTVHRLSYSNTFVPFFPSLESLYVQPVAITTQTILKTAAFADPIITIDNYISEQLTS